MIVMAHSFWNDGKNIELHLRISLVEKVLISFTEKLALKINFSVCLIL